MARSHADPRLLALAALCAAPGALCAEGGGKIHVFDDVPGCVASHRFTLAQCAAAAAAASAEFSQKVPHFPSREACESLFPQAGCSIAFLSGDSAAGGKAALYFTPRRTGFRIFVASAQDIRVLPQAVGEGIRFQAHAIPGSARVDPKPAHAAAPAAPDDPGLEAPPPRVGSLPPPPRFDPNFDCAAVLEPSARASADTACYPAPSRRR